MDGAKTIPARNDTTRIADDDLSHSRIADDDLSHWRRGVEREWDEADAVLIARKRWTAHDGDLQTLPSSTREQWALDVRDDSRATLAWALVTAALAVSSSSAAWDVADLLHEVDSLVRLASVGAAAGAVESAVVEATLQSLDAHTVAAMTREKRAQVAFLAAATSRAETLVFLGLAVPWLEELVFRGPVLAVASGAASPWWGVAGMVASAAVFGAVHGDRRVGRADSAEAARIAATAVAGLCYGCVGLATGSLVACVAAHATHNALVVADVLLPRASSDEEGVDDELSAVKEETAPPSRRRTE